MTKIRFIVYPIAVIILLSCCLSAFAQEGKATFTILDKDPAVVDVSRKTRESGTVFRDKNGDGIYDSLAMKSLSLECDIDDANAYGVTYLDQKKVVFYPSASSSIPVAGQSVLYGFIHYFDNEGQSVYFAIIVSRLSETEEQALKKTNKKVIPYQADFIDSNGLRVGVPTLMLLPHSKLLYNAEFQKFNKSSDTVLLGTNPASPNRELYIFRKVPENKDNLLLIHYKWY